MKVIPAIDLMNGQVVRLYKGDPNQKTIYSDDPISVSKKMGRCWSGYDSSCRFRCYFGYWVLNF
jgi:1-(5-phosphoribosyl)-5-[(5-phosphoribosylamino)methylideneamino] imidazole-4-carboxamide isomerase (EC 5.3.1.16)